MTDKRYNLRGVSSQKEDVHNAIKNIDKGLFPKAFCKVVPDFLTGSEAHCLVMHADGAGTKSSLAYAYWKETGDLSVWKGIAQDALIMNIDDLLCVGVTNDILLSSTIGRNKNKITAQVLAAIINGTEELLANLGQLGVKIHSTGGETADVGDLVKTIIVDSTFDQLQFQQHNSQEVESQKAAIKARIDQTGKSFTQPNGIMFGYPLDIVLSGIVDSLYTSYGIFFGTDLMKRGKGRRLLGRRSFDTGFDGGKINVIQIGIFITGNHAML